MKVSIEKTKAKIFQPLKDLQKYGDLVKTTENILYECQLFLKNPKHNSDPKIKFLRLYDTFMLISTVFLSFFVSLSQISFRTNPSFSLKWFHMIFEFLFILSILLQKLSRVLNLFQMHKFLSFPVQTKKTCLISIEF